MFQLPLCAVPIVALRLTFVSLLIKLNCVPLPVPVLKRNQDFLSSSSFCCIAYRHVVRLGDVQSHEVHTALVLCEIRRSNWGNNILRTGGGQEMGNIIWWENSNLEDQEVGAS
jgi:hypothetical protein